MRDTLRAASDDNLVIIPMVLLVVFLILALLLRALVAIPGVDRDGPEDVLGLNAVPPPATIETYAMAVGLADNRGARPPTVPT